MIATGIFWTAPKTVEVKEFEVREPGKGEVLLEAEYSLVSPGTEREWLIDDRSHGVLGTTFPFCPGYSFAGRVLRIGDGVTGWCVGDPVVSELTVTGAHASHAVISADRLIRVPENVPLREAVFFNLGMTAVHTIRLATTGAPSEIAIVGQGPIGVLATQIAKSLDLHEIIALDLDADRLEKSRESGATRTLNPAVGGELGTFIQETGGVSAVVDLSGAATGLNTALKLAKPLGRVVCSTGTAERLEIEYGDLFVKGLTVVGAFVGARPAEAAQDVQYFLDILAAGRINIGILAAEEFAPSDAKAVYERVLAQDRSLLVPIFVWGGPACSQSAPE